MLMVDVGIQIGLMIVDIESNKKVRNKNEIL